MKCHVSFFAPLFDQGMRQLRMHMLASQGYCVICVDSRGSRHRGVEFESYIRRRMGTVELSDQVEVLRILADQLGYIDMDRVAIHGWSYGKKVDSFAVFYCSFFLLTHDGALSPRWLPKSDGAGAIPGNIQSFHRGCTGHELGVLRHRLHRALHGPAGQQPVWLCGRLGAQLHPEVSRRVSQKEERENGREEETNCNHSSLMFHFKSHFILQGQSAAHHPRTDRRKCTLSPHVPAGEPARAGKQTVPAAGVPERAPLAAQSGGEQALRDEAALVSAEPSLNQRAEQSETTNRWQTVFPTIYYAVLCCIVSHLSQTRYRFPRFALKFTNE